MFALVLSALSLGAALAPAPEEDDEGPATTRARPRATPGPTQIQLRQPAPETPPDRRVRAGAHVILRVSARQSGSVEVPALGLIQPVEPDTPALFDLIAARPGRYDVNLLSTDAESTRLGTLVVAR